MLLKYFYTVMLLLFATSQIYSQNISLSNWEVHTTMNAPTTATQDSKNRIWVGSQGGIAIFGEKNISEKDTNNENTILLNASNGLLNPTINILKYIPFVGIDNTRGIMLAGTNNGVVELIDENTLECRHITGIRDHNFIDPRINDFAVLPNDDGSTKILIAGGFGMVEYHLQRNIFMDAAQTINDFTKNAPVNNVIIHNDSIWIASSFGIAKIGLKDKINIPSNWKTYRFNTPYANAKIVRIDNKFYVNFPTEIFEFDGEKFLSIYKTTDEIIDIGNYNEKLIFSTKHHILGFENIGEQPKHLYYQGEGIRGFTVINHPQIKIVSFYELLGSAFIEEDFSATVKTPNTPITNLFLTLALDNNGKLFTVSDNSQKNNTVNAYIGYDGKKWTNYHPRLLASHPQDDRMNYVSIAVSPDNKIYAGSWGDGLMVMDENQDTVIYQRYTEENSALLGHNTTGDYVIAGQTCFDNRGRAWVANYGINVAGNMLVAFNPDGSSVGFGPVWGQGNSRSVFNLAIDANNTKWIGGHKEGQPGLFYFNERGTLEDTSDDIWGNLTTTNTKDLMSNFFTSIAYDRFLNLVWLGTENGVAIINNPNAVLNSTNNPNLAITKSKLLEGQHINNIFIDAIGNKWISTRNGIWVISIDGGEVIARWTTENTPLFSNEVQAITINPDNGLVYIGTKEGLFIAQSTVLKPQTEYTITVYPQPFNINRDKEIIIDGLTTDSDIRIITPDGMLVRSIFTSSRRAVWDGKDNNDNIVPPGVYLIISSSSVANTSGAGKIAVVK